MVKKNTPMMSSSDTKHRFSLSVEGGGGRPTPKNLDKQNKNKNKTPSMYDM